MREGTDPQVEVDYAPTEAEHPGTFPYTRGIASEPKVWVMGQYAGFGTPAESNERFRTLLDAGVTGFSVALDLPTQAVRILQSHHRRILQAPRPHLAYPRRHAHLRHRLFRNRQNELL